jgi:hypothetical protein
MLVSRLRRGPFTSSVSAQCSPVEKPGSEKLAPTAHLGCLPWITSLIPKSTTRPHNLRLLFLFGPGGPAWDGMGWGANSG